MAEEKHDPAEEEAYWRRWHASQTYASKEDTFEQYAPAYRVGYEAATKYPGKKFEEIEDEVALDYEKAQPGSALPWDSARHATRAAWSKVSGVVTPRDTDRGMRTGL
ncbi:MAG: hypothetical protein QOI04_1224 [Verrucomicrobiota bacterium]|jgi:hypothetical protein